MRMPAGEPDRGRGMLNMRQIRNRPSVFESRRELYLAACSNLGPCGMSDLGYFEYSSNLESHV